MRQSDHARVAAVKFLADLELYRRDGDEQDWARERAKKTAKAAERFSRLIEQRVRAHKEGQVRDALDELAAELSKEAEAADPDLIVGDIDGERARAVLEQPVPVARRLRWRRLR